MRNRYIVTYDITDDRRRTAVYKCLRGFGDHLQYSVFRCDLVDRRRGVRPPEGTPGWRGARPLALLTAGEAR